MRKMYSYKQLLDIVNEQLASGNVGTINADTINVDTIGGVTNFNGEENPSVKPIYYHPISLYGGENGMLSFLILDNSPTPYTKETLLTKLANFDRISPLSGIFKHDTKWLIAGYAWKSANAHYVLGACTDGSTITGVTEHNSLEDFINLATTSVSDGVNKIN